VAVLSLAAALVAVGGAGGGASLAPTTRLAAVAFSSPTDGFGYFSVATPAGGPCRGLVGRTADGGGRFAGVATVDSWGCGGSAPATSLATDGRGDVFLYGPGLFASHDNGAAWAQPAQHGNVLAVEARGRSVWMVEADCPGAGPGAPPPCALHLVESADGGRDWRTAPTQPPGATAPGAGEPALGQTWLVRTGRSSAYVVSAPPATTGGSADDAPLWRTDDGGRTWTRRQIPCGIDALSVVVSAAPEGTLLAVCAGQPTAGYEMKSSARSTDGGLRWSTHVACSPSPDSLAFFPAGCVGEPLDSGYLAGVDAVSGTTAFVVGDRAPLRVSHDGGARWRTVAPAIGSTGGGTSQVVFFSPRDGIVVGTTGTAGDRATLWTTRDGGARWTALVPQVAAPSTPASKVVLGPDGLRVVEIGAPRASAVSTLERDLGAPTRTTAGVCPGRTEVEWGDLSLEFSAGRLAGYRYLRGGLFPPVATLSGPSAPLRPLLATTTGVTLGATLGRVRALYPAGDFSEANGGSLVVPGRSGTDTLRLLFFDDTAAAPLAEVKGGEPCGDV
jgi:photosystem II stability/assembly factor-like uncharacterized protein